VADFEAIRYDVTDGVAVITLHRPEKMNAFNMRMMHEMMAAFDLVDADDDVRAVIVTGEGRAFCAGADLTPDKGQSSGGNGGPFANASAARNDDGSYDYSDEAVRDSGGKLTLRIFECLKPVIAAVNGAAVGIGATMQMPMDIRLASTKARYGFVFARRGIVPEAASSWFLPKLVGVSKALEWCMTGRIFGAEEALDGGLVRSIHEPEDLLPAAMEIAREIVDNTAPVSVALTRHMLWRLPSGDHPMAAHKIDSRGVFTRAKSGDAKEGITSFLEKRDPVYPDKVSKDMPDYFPWWEDPDYS